MKFLAFSIILSLFFFPYADQESYLIVGTYDSPKSEGIYVYKFNSADGSIKEAGHIKTANPSFVTVSPNEKFIYAVYEIASAGKGGEVAAFSFNKKNGELKFINQQLTGGDHPCYVEIDKTGKWVIVANYTSGSLSVLPVNTDGSLGVATTTIQHTGSGKNIERQKGPHVHCTVFSPDNKWLFATDLGIDKLIVYSFDDKIGKLTKTDSITVESGGGPRHFTFHPSGKYAYLIDELSSFVHVLEWKKNKLFDMTFLPAIPPHYSGPAGSADIHVSPDGKFLYISNRAESNTITIFKIDQRTGLITMTGHNSTLGKTPRNFNFDPTGNFLLVANQESDEVVIFKRNKQTGLLTDTGKRINVGKPVCLKWVKVE